MCQPSLQFKKDIADYNAYKKEIELPSASNDSKLLPMILKDHFAVILYTRRVFSCPADGEKF